MLNIKCLILILLYFLSGCKKEYVVDADRIPTNGIVLTSWQMLGPFPDKMDNYLYFDNLKQMGFSEDRITFKEYHEIAFSDTIRKNQFYRSDSSYVVDFNKIFGYTKGNSIKANVYCACVIRSTRKRNLRLNFSADNGSKIWLNHQLVHEYNCKYSQGLNYYQHYIPLNLEKGDNFLLIKVNNTGLRWEMFAAIEQESSNGLRKNQIAYLVKHGKNFLDRSVINDSTLYLNHFLPSDEGLFSVKESNNHILFSDSIHDLSKKYGKDVSGLPKGLYTASLSVRNITCTQKLFIGNIVDDIGKLIKSIQQCRTDEATMRNIEALTFRYNHLMKPENAGNKFEWDKKLILIYENLNRYYKNIRNKMDPDFEAFGGLLKSYVSRIDNGTQYYQIFVPKSYSKGKPMPMVIEMPKYMQRFNSPLETFRFANIHLIETFEDLADKYNMIILDPGCRSVKVNTNAIDEADLWENLEDVKKYFTIDTTRIFLRGACLSARTALRLATKYPDKFAAISFTAPELSLSKNKNIWVQQNEPINYLGNITYMPVLNIHAVNDAHSPISGSESLMEEAKKTGMKKFTYNKLPFELKTYYDEEYFDDVFSFYSKYSVDYKPKEIRFSTSQLKYNKSFWITLNCIVSAKNANIRGRIENNRITILSENVISYTLDLTTLPYNKTKELVLNENNKEVYRGIPVNSSMMINPQVKPKGVFIKKHEVEGPFAHIFSKPFIAVTGTNGNAEENKRMQMVTDTINRYWKLKYYSPCRTKRDKDITEADLKNYSLLLIGSPTTNYIFKKFGQYLPVSIKDNSVTIGKNRVNGIDLCFYVIFPNPENTNNYIGIIGGNHIVNLTIGVEEPEKKLIFNDIANYGWNDYSIWESSTLKIASSGYLNFYWH
jgi:dienelactone hydrolase